jgi:hypothetical protein
MLTEFMHYIPDVQNDFSTFRLFTILIHIGLLVITDIYLQNYNNRYYYYYSYESIIELLHYLVLIV